MLHIIFRQEITLPDEPIRPREHFFPYFLFR